MKILICTGIYPPHVGGPAQYAKEVKNEFERQGHTVKVLTYELERKLPTLIRHKLFFWRAFFNVWGVDFVLALDTFSVGWPASLAAKIWGKSILLRTGGDFLWESYVERTGDLVLFKNFYSTSLSKLNLKEKVIFGITKRTLKRVSGMIFSTEWQKDVFTKAYSLDPKKNFIVENFYGEKLVTEQDDSHQLEASKVFVAGTRPLVWKNIPRLISAFEKTKAGEVITYEKSLELDLGSAPYEQFLEKIKKCYAVILVSLGDISPNMILDAIRCNKPFILTRETGLYDKLKDVGIFVDPENEDDITKKILFLSNRENYEIQKKKIELFTFTHSWQEICNEILEIFQKIKK